MRAALLMLFALAVMVVLFVPLLVIQLIRHAVMRKPLADVFWNAAIGLDQLGGAILYGEPDWTVSSRTYWLASRGNRFAAWFEVFIDLLFGEGHCRQSWRNEFLGEK